MSLLLLLLGLLAPAHEGNPFLDKFLSASERQIEAKDWDGALHSLERVLDRSPRHPRALEGMVYVARMTEDLDLEVWALHRLRNLESQTKNSKAAKGEGYLLSKPHAKRLKELDPKVHEVEKVRQLFLSKLQSLGRRHANAGHPHLARMILKEAALVSPGDPKTLEQLATVQASIRASLPPSELFGGADPTFGVDPAWIAEQDKEHNTWDTAWTKETANYRYKTDAGFVVLQTASIAMEQMNRAYRKFFHYMEDGGNTPQIWVNLFQNREEYLTLGQGPPASWSQGHFTGSAVETYANSDGSAESIRGMYTTLFHEAAHQFVRLTGKQIPGWLNEAYACFFEGTILLSDGTVRWNQVAQHRLFPLSRRMQAGWMATYSDGLETPTSYSPRCPTPQILVESEFAWGPNWYEPSWGFIYFLYNYRDKETGKTVWRDRLHKYYESRAGSKALADRVPHFESIFLKDNELSPVKDITELGTLWGQWIVDLAAAESGTKKSEQGALEHGATALEKGDLDLASELLEEAFLDSPEDPEVLWKLAVALEQQGTIDRAISLYLSFAQAMRVRGKEADPRVLQAERRIQELDPLHAAYTSARKGFEESTLKAVKSYRERKLPRMALETARKLCLERASESAFELYKEIATETNLRTSPWKLLYNELDLSGWRKATGSAAEGRAIRLTASDPQKPVQLLCDDPFDEDFSLVAELRLTEGAKSAGLCFGVQDKDFHHAIMLLEDGSISFNSKVAGTLRERTKIPLPNRKGWRELRIDVIGKRVEVLLDGALVLKEQVTFLGNIKGDYGLQAQTGEAWFREVRMLARPANDPIARLERDLLLERLQATGKLRHRGALEGTAAPELTVQHWVQGRPQWLADAMSRPIVLLFWLPGQQTQQALAQRMSGLLEQFRDSQLLGSAIASSSFTLDEIRDALRSDAFIGWSMAGDLNYGTFESYHLQDLSWPLPHATLVDVNGLVLWEGNPLELPSEDELSLESAVAELSSNRGLHKLREAKKAYEKAELAFREKDIPQTLQALSWFEGVDVPGHTTVRKAIDLRDRIAAVVVELLQRADLALEKKHYLEAMAIYQFAANRYRGCEEADLAHARELNLKENLNWQRAQQAWELCDQWVKSIPPDTERSYFSTSHLEQALALNATPEVKEWVAKLKESMRKHGVRSCISLWDQLQYQIVPLEPEELASPDDRPFKLKHLFHDVREELEQRE